MWKTRGHEATRGIFFGHESYLSNITNKVAVIVPRRRGWIFNCAAIKRISQCSIHQIEFHRLPLRAGRTTIRMQRLIIQKMFRPISSSLRFVFANVSDPAILSILYCFFHIAAWTFIATDVTIILIYDNPFVCPTIHPPSSSSKIISNHRRISFV